MSKGNHGGRQDMHSGELRSMVSQVMSGNFDSPSNRGQRKRMDASPVVGGFSLLQTQLITMRIDKPAQLVVTMMTPAKGSSGTTPWIASWDNTTTPPSTPGQVFTAPRLPDPAQGLRCELRWGAGGAAGVTQFDYPATGACFGLTADTIDLYVLKPVDAGSPLVYAEANIPYVGAFWVPGQAADPTPLRWLQAFNILTTTDPVYYAVKPYSRTVHIQVDASDIAVDFLDTALGVLWRARFYEPVAGAGVDVHVPVPSQATIMLVGNTSSTDADYLCVEWEIGLV